MNATLLERLLAVAKKTGDRLVVVEGDNAVVLLPIERYEELLVGAPASVSIRQSEMPIEKRERIEERPSVFEEPSISGFRTDIRQVPQDLRVLDSIANETAIDEEQFYLEPVE
ncbi:hypothetical protein KBD18_02690 [Patescibacteria group bacterium]|nr:hypothetical protein [Patescibacteria group bacterium]